MEWPEIEERLLSAAEQFLLNDRYLLEVDANERSLTHQFAAYLKPLFKCYDVDCEYNRRGVDKKTLPDALWKQVPTDDTNASTVFPDIIVHHRGEDNYNLMVIEAKKSHLAVDDDIAKLLAYALADDLQYQHAVLLRFDIGDAPKISVERIAGAAG